MQCYRVSEVPRGIPATTKKLYISHSKIRYIKLSDFIGIPDLQELVLFSSGTEAVENNTFKALNNLRMLEVLKNKLTNVPSPLPSSLEMLKLADNSIRIIHQHDFDSLKNLRELEIQNNNLYTLSFSIFSALLNMQTLILDGNGIEGISGLVRLPQLKYLSIENNKLQYFPENFFAYFPNLQYLRLAGNQLTKIPIQLPKSLLYLRLERNLIKNVKIRDLKNLENLSDLNLSGNQLSSVDGLQVLVNLSSIDISKNKLSALPHRLPAKLQRLDCSNNQIYRVTIQDLKCLQNLKHLFLDNNVVSRLEDGAFQWCAFLSNLAMEQNLLTSIPQELPSTLTRLDLKGNKIAGIGERDFKNMKLLQVLNLRNNRISSLDHQVFEYLPRLRHLYLDGNPWNCTCKLLKIKRVLLDKGTDIKGGQCAEPSYCRGENWMSSETVRRHCEITYAFDKGKDNRKKMNFDELSIVKIPLDDDDYDYDID
ncbi:nephrocan-like [Discoglossus pictus]